MSEFEEFTEKLAPLVGKFELSEIDKEAQQLAYKNPFPFTRAKQIIMEARIKGLDPQILADWYILASGGNFTRLSKR